MRACEIDIVGLVPAAGRSSRMGADKRRLPLRGSTVLESTVESLLLGGCAKVIVVLEPRSPCLALPLISGASERVIPFPLESSSPSMRHSITQGMSHLSHHAVAAVMPSDCPLVRPRTIATLIQIARAHSSMMLVPYFRSQQGHPRFIPAALLEALRNLPADARFSEVFRHYPECVMRIECEDENILYDLDQPADYRQALAGGSCRI